MEDELEEEEAAEEMLRLLRGDHSGHSDQAERSRRWPAEGGEEEEGAEEAEAEAHSIATGGSTGYMSATSEDAGRAGSGRQHHCLCMQEWELVGVAACWHALFSSLLIRPLGALEAHAPPHTVPRHVLCDWPAKHVLCHTAGARDDSEDEDRKSVGRERVFLTV